MRRSFWSCCSQPRASRSRRSSRWDRRHTRDSAVPDPGSRTPIRQPSLRGRRVPPSLNESRAAPASVPVLRRGRRAARGIPSQAGRRDASAAGPSKRIPREWQPHRLEKFPRPPNGRSTASVRVQRCQAVSDDVPGGCESFHLEPAGERSRRRAGVERPGNPPSAGDSTAAAQRSRSTAFLTRNRHTKTQNDTSSGIPSDDSTRIERRFASARTPARRSRIDCGRSHTPPRNKCRRARRTRRGRPGLNVARAVAPDRARLRPKYDGSRRGIVNDRRVQGSEVVISGGVVR
jgi:hypothetical protein